MNAMLYVLLLLSLILCCVAATQNSALAQTPPPAISTPAPPPLPPNPVDTFRKILGMSEPEREKFLATLAPDKRQVVVLKLEEYQGLSAEDREKRLRALQARVWVRQLIKVAPSNRVERLAALAPAERELVQIRLAEWDRLPADLQKEILANELAIRHIARSPDYMFRHAMPPLPVVTKTTAMLDHWLNKSEAERAEIIRHYETFFETVSSEDLAKIMAKRPEIAKAAPIGRLAKEQRERYIAGFKRFTSLTPAERQKFLINVSHWQKMTPEQRQSWRVLAKKLTPPPAPPPVPGRPWDRRR